MNAISAPLRKSMCEALAAGIQDLDLKILAATQSTLIQYLELLLKWNAIHNLTAVRDPLEMVYRHLLDSLALSPFLFPETEAPRVRRVLDVGTGAGLPGIPLALSQPTQNFFLIDSSQKKIAFVHHVIHSLDISNARAVCVRVERYQPTEAFDWVVSRAFGSVSDFSRVSYALCKPEGSLVAMKGVLDPAELAAIPAEYHYRTETLKTLPASGFAARSLVFISPH